MKKPALMVKNTGDIKFIYTRNVKMINVVIEGMTYMNGIRTVTKKRNFIIEN